MAPGGLILPTRKHVCEKKTMSLKNIISRRTHNTFFIMLLNNKIVTMALY
jgi:hypothetical protein